MIFEINNDKLNMINEMVVAYNDSNCNVAVIEVEYEDNEPLILSESIAASDINLPGKKGKKTRYIMISNSKNASHAGRMKVSEIGDSNMKKNCVSFYVTDEKNGIVKSEGIMKSMSNKEKEMYEQLCLRHNNLIQFAKLGVGDVDTAFVQDELRYQNNEKYFRDKDGTLTLYDNNGNEIKYNIKGEQV